MLVMFTNSTYIIMEKNESIEHVLDNMEPKIVYKKKSSGIISLLLIAIGAVSFFIYTSFEWQRNDVFPHFLFITGLASNIIGILLFCLRSSNYVSVESNQRLKAAELYFNPKEQNKLVAFIESGSLAEIKNLKSSVSAGLRLRVLATKDGQICLSQVIAYSSNEYVNITSPKTHSLAEAQQLRVVLQR
jgi:hypothetical protein